MHQYLSATEKMALERFNADPYMVEAVRKVILSRVYNDGVLQADAAAEPLRNFMLNIADSAGHNLTDQELGALTRTRRIAVELLELGMKDIKKFEHIKPTKPKESDYR